jgi:Zn finger protein HypA/HybF involved in hydrogenase expression
VKRHNSGVPEITAKAKFSCPSCGAEARWDPARKALVCPYCGTVAPGELASDGSKIREIDRSLGTDDRGWQTERTAVKCQSCQAICVFEPKHVAQRCEFCGSAQLVAYEETKAPIRPESLLPFKISESDIRESIRKWYASRWFAPNRLKRGALTDTVHGLYIPYWTFDAQVHAAWTAEAGHHYFESESYTDSNGRSQTRQVQRTRWVSAAGDLEHFFDDELVPATVGVPPDLLRKVEPFPTAELVPYDASYVSGWVVEQYQIDLVAAAQQAQSEMKEKVNALCAAEVPGDTYRNLHVEADFSAQTFKHMLVPVWMLTYTFGAAVYAVVVNGYTGAIAGRYPKSWIKIALLVLLILAILLVVFAIQNQ